MSKRTLLDDELTSEKLPAAILAGVILCVMLGLLLWGMVKFRIGRDIILVGASVILALASGIASVAGTSLIFRPRS